MYLLYKRFEMGIVLKVMNESLKIVLKAMKWVFDLKTGWVNPIWNRIVLKSGNESLWKLSELCEINLFV